MEDGNGFINELENIFDKYEDVFEALKYSSLSIELEYYVMNNWRKYFKENKTEYNLSTSDIEINKILNKDKGFIKYKNNEKLLSEIGVENAGIYILNRLHNKITEKT